MRSALCPPHRSLPDSLLQRHSLFAPILRLAIETDSSLDSTWGRRSCRVELPFPAPSSNQSDIGISAWKQRCNRPVQAHRFLRSQKASVGFSGRFRESMPTHAGTHTCARTRTHTCQCAHARTHAPTHARKALSSSSVETAFSTGMVPTLGETSCSRHGGTSALGCQGGLGQVSHPTAQPERTGSRTPQAYPKQLQPSPPTPYKFRQLVEAARDWLQPKMVGGRPMGIRSLLGVIGAI